MSDLDLAAAVADLRLVVATGLTEIRGSLALLLQRDEQADRRVDEIAARLTRAEDELDTLKRDAVTKADHAERNRRLLTIIGLMLTAATGVTALLALIIRP